MPQTIEPPTRTLPTALSPRVRWNVDQLENLCALGLLPDGAYELIEGDIIPKAPIKYVHGFVQTALMFLLARLVGQEYVITSVSLQVNSESLPEPDLAVTVEPRAAYLTRRYLRPDDLRLVAEVSDTTLAEDLTTKARLYAHAGIAEYWVIDVTGRRLLIHGEPASDGYSAVTEYREGENGTPLFAPESAFSVSEIFPPALP